MQPRPALAEGGIAAKTVMCSGWWVGSKPQGQPARLHPSSIRPINNTARACETTHHPPTMTVWIIDDRHVIELATLNAAANPYAGADVTYLVGSSR